MISDTISGFNDPDWLEPHPRGAHGHSQLQGSDVAAWAAASTVGFRSTGAPRRASTGNVEANLASHPPDGSGGFDEADLWGLRFETDHGFGSWAWAARAAAGSPSRGAPENAPAGDAEANHTTMGSDDPPRAWAPEAPDRDDNASVASQAGTRTAGAHAPVDMHVALGAEEALGAGHDHRHEPRGHGRQWYHDVRGHFTPPPSDKAHDAPGEGVLEEERSQPQSRALLTPAALDGGVQAGAAPGVRALRTCKPPALHDTHKHVARRGAATPPQRTVGKGADTEGDLPSDKGDRYVALDGTSLRPERRADRAELAEMRAELEHVRAQVRTLRDKARARDLEKEAGHLFDTIERDTEHHELSIIRAALAAAAARQRGRPGDVGDPAANPVHHPSSGRVTWPRAAEQSAPSSAAARTASRKTDGPLSGAAAPGGGGRPEADPAERLPHHSGFNAIHPVTRPATHFWDKKPSLAAAAPAAVPPRSDPAPSPEAGKGEAHSGRVERGHHMGQSNGRPPARDPYADSREQPDESQQGEELSVRHAQATCEQLTTTTREGATWEAGRQAADGARTPTRAMGRKDARPATPRTGYAAVGAPAIPCIRQGASTHLDCPQLALGEDSVPVAMTRFGNLDGSPSNGRAVPIALIAHSERIAYLARVRVEELDHGTYPDLVLNVTAAACLKVGITDEAGRCCQSNGMWMHAVRRAEVPIVGYASVVVSYAPAGEPFPQRRFGDSPPGRGKWAYALVAVIKDGQRLPAGAHLKAMPGWSEPSMEAPSTSSATQGESSWLARAPRRSPHAELQRPAKWISPTPPCRPPWSLRTRAGRRTGRRRTT